MQFEQSNPPTHHSLVMSPAAPEVQPDSELNAPESAAKIRTLIVDDEPLSREVLRRLLVKEPDIDIIGLPTSSREAVELINRLEPDLVFLDVQMPELDGFEVLSQVRCAHTPTAIFVTANDSFAQRADEVHALDFMVKPCTRQRLQAALQRARERFHRLTMAANPATSDPPNNCLR
jgi:two-component system LytT family response regulator